MENKYDGTITKDQIEEAHLDWNDVSKKLIDNRWALPKSLTEVIVTANLTKMYDKMSAFFGDNFDKILPILEKSLGGIGVKDHIGNEMKYRYVTLETLEKNRKEKEQRNANKKETESDYLKKKLLLEGISLHEKVFLVKRLKWQFLRRNDAYRNECAKWFDYPNPTKEDLKREYDRISENWGFPPVNPDKESYFEFIFLPSAETNPDKYKLHKECYEEDGDFEIFILSSHDHVVRLNWMSKDIFDFPLKKEMSKFPFHLDPYDIATLNFTVNILYPEKEIISIISKQIQHYQSFHKNLLEIKIDRKRLDKFANCLRVYDLRKKGVVKKCVLESEYSNGGKIFEWLMKHGYFEEANGTEGYPRVLSEGSEIRIEKEFPTDSKEILTILKKRKTWLEIAKETRFYGFEDNEFKDKEAIIGLFKELANSFIQGMERKDVIEMIAELGIQEVAGEDVKEMIVEKMLAVSDFQKMKGQDVAALLNNLLKDKNLYKRFPYVELMQEEQELKKRISKLSEYELMHLNRIILERTFPDTCPIKFVLDETLYKQVTDEYDKAEWFINQGGYRQIR